MNSLISVAAKTPNAGRSVRRLLAVLAMLLWSFGISAAEGQTAGKRPPAKPFAVKVSPSKGRLGTPVTITVTGLDGTGRVDFSTSYPIGSTRVRGTTAVLKTRIWNPGVVTITAEWVRYTVGVADTVTAQTTFNEVTTGSTTPPTTTIPATTIPVTSLPPTVTTTTVVTPTTSATTTTTTTTAPTTTVATTTPSTTAPRPLPNPVFFVIDAVGLTTTKTAGDDPNTPPYRSPWLPGSETSQINGPVLSGTGETFSAQVFFDGPYVAAGRAVNLSGLPLTLVDRESPVVPSVKFVALDLNGGTLSDSGSTPCRSLSTSFGPGVFTCNRGEPLVFPTGTSKVLIVVSSSTPLYLGSVPSSPGGPVTSQTGVGANYIPS